MLVAVDGLTQAEAGEITRFCGDLFTDHEVLVSPLAISAAHLDKLRQRERLITREIARDGVAL